MRHEITINLTPHEREFLERRARANGRGAAEEAAEILRTELILGEAVRILGESDDADFAEEHWQPQTSSRREAGSRADREG
jgi:hypothetical protein